MKKSIAYVLIVVALFLVIKPLIGYICKPGSGALCVLPIVVLGGVLLLVVTIFVNLVKHFRSKKTNTNA